MHVEPPNIDDGYVEFFTSGAQMTGEFHCASCGYGIVCRGELPDCPMCHESTWESAAWRPFGGSANGAARIASASRVPDAILMSLQDNDGRGRQT